MNSRDIQIFIGKLNDFVVWLNAVPIIGGPHSQLWQDRINYVSQIENLINFLQKDLSNNIKMGIKVSS